VLTPASAGRLGKLFNADTPARLLKNSGNFVVDINRYMITLSVVL
jgi:hypothetical protein